LGKPYVYKTPGDHGEYDLLSYGKDGKRAVQTKMLILPTGKGRQHVYVDATTDGSAYAI